MNAIRAKGPRTRTTRRRVVLAVVGAVTTALVATTLAVTGPASVAAVDGPRYPVPQPRAVEAFARYVPQASCEPIAKRGVVRFRDMMRSYYGGGLGNIGRACLVGTSEHWDGRAWDWMLDYYDPTERSIANRALAWLLEPGADGVPAERARRLGIMYIIWNARIWSSYRVDDGWRPYTRSNPHRDHIHISFSWEGARGITSFWDGTVAAQDYGPCRAHVGDPARLWRAANPDACPPPAPARYVVTRPTLLYGMQSTMVRNVQSMLGSTATGYYGSVTLNAVAAYQARRGLPVTGAVDPTTWGVLDPRTIRRPPGTPPPPPPPPPPPATGGLPLRQGMSGTLVRSLQTRLGVPTQYRTGYFGAVTLGYVRDFQATRRLPVTGVVDRRTYDATVPRQAPRTLTVGMSGSDVRVLQTRLVMPTRYRTGYFGSITRTAVRAFQTRHRLPVTGVAEAPTRAWLGM